MKKILLAAVLACACLQTANAQKPQRSFENKKDLAEKMVDRMDDALDLNDKQEKDLLKVYTDLFCGKKAMKTGDKMSRINARKDFNEKVNAILTAEQQKKWAELKLKQADKRKDAIKKGKEFKKNTEDLAEKMVDRMDDALDLNDKQEDELTKIYNDFYCVNKMAKSGDKMARLKARKDLNEKINAVLTANQQKKWAELKLKQTDKRKDAFKKNKKND